MNLDEYAGLDALGLAALVKSRQVSADELAQTALAAVAAVNEDLNAVIETFPDGAPGAMATPSLDTPFAGVPFLVKDVGLHFGGIKCEFCSRLCEGMVADADSHYARLVRRSGVSIVGRSNTPEFSMSASSENLLHGATSTPWKKGYSACGSTGGGAAAVAAGIVPLAHGSDIGGSIRGPAAWCGGVGLKPSRGRISAGPGYDEWGHGMSMTFAQTRTMRDTAALLDCLAVPQPGDPFRIARPAAPYSAYLAPKPRPLRIAFSSAALMDAPVDTEIAAAVETVATTLAGLGHEVREDAPPIDLEVIDDASLRIWFFDFHRRLDEYGRRMGRRVAADTVEAATLRFYEFARRVTHTEFFEAQQTLNAVRRSTGPFFDRYDAWLSPTMAQVSARHGVFNMNVDLEPRAFLAHEQRPCQFLMLANVTGQPAISLPLAMHSNGLPIGVQLSARPAEEHLLIKLGAELEQAMPWRARRPALHVAATR